MAKQVSILIAEDESIIALDIKKTLEKLGYHVAAVVNNGEDVLREVALNTFQLILMDIQLNGEKTGIDIAEEIMSKFNIPVIYLTALTDQETVNKAKRTNPYGFILKPFDEESLHSIIQKTMETIVLKKDTSIKKNITDNNGGLKAGRLYKNISVLLSDFEISGTVDDITPEMLLQELNEIVIRAEEIISELGLKKINLQDMYSVCSAVSAGVEDHALMIIKAAFEIKHYIEQRNKNSSYQWVMRAGISSGEAVIRPESSNSNQLNITGEAFHIANKIEKHSEPGMINISGATYRLIKDSFVCEYCGRLLTKNNYSIDMYHVKDTSETLRNLNGNYLYP